MASLADDAMDADTMETEEDVLDAATVRFTRLPRFLRAVAASPDSP